MILEKFESTGNDILLATVTDLQAEGVEISASSLSELAKSVCDRLASIHDGRAEKDLLPVAEQKLTNQESVDFNATAGMVAGITEKAKALPDREVFHPIMTGFGTVDRAAIDSWRIFVTSSSPALGQQPRTLGRGISL